MIGCFIVVWGEVYVMMFGLVCMLTVEIVEAFRSVGI